MIISSLVDITFPESIKTYNNNYDVIIFKMPYLIYEYYCIHKVTVVIPGQINYYYELVEHEEYKNIVENY